MDGVMLAHVMPNGFDPTGWLVSEKLDGIRAVWVPGRGLFTRSGNPIHAPDWFLAELPANTPLDGELFAGRGGFQRVSSIVRKKTPVDAEWRQITYHVFDSPGAGSTSQRLNRIARLRPRTALAPVAQTAARNRQHLDQMLQNVLRKGGEGLMVRDPAAPYERRRSHAILKVKPTLDTEGVVVDLLEGKGKYQGKLGKVRVRLGNGKTVLVGSGFTDAQRAQFWDPRFLGTIITLKYMTLTNGGIPRQPVFDRVRHDAGL